VSILVAEQTGQKTYDDLDDVAVLIGPEGGWSDEEKQFFKDKNITHLSISEFTLRAETAAVTAVVLLS
jgi:RsmE family RNA methyltransferase